MATASSDFLLIFHETALERYHALSAEQRRQVLERWNAWCDDLAAQGKLRSGNTLAPERRIVSGAGHAVDGPFAEAKELIGGYILLQAESLDEATAIAQTCPNLPYGMVVEVRPIAQACHLARSLGWSTMRGPAEQPA
ncbi:MAG TPA: YciI family protein [Longimicrobiales bacterium]